MSSDGAHLQALITPAVLVATLAIDVVRLATLPCRIALRYGRRDATAQPH